MQVLGEFTSSSSLLSIGHKTVDIIDPAAGNKVVLKGAPNNVPNQVIIHGTVDKSNAIINLQWHGGKVFPGTPGADWRILGDKGELRLISPSFTLNVAKPDTKIEVVDAATGVVELVKADTDEWDALPLPAQNIARLYEAYRLKEWYPNFDWAVKRHKMIDELFKSFDARSH